MKAEILYSLKYFIIMSSMALVMIVLLSKCEERFTPDLDSKYENVMVVEGEISNTPGPYTITLTSSVSVNTSQAIPLTGYKVEIIDDLGNSEILNESEKGIYSTSPDGIQGAVGRQYKLSIVATNGREYETDFELLRPPPPIDSVFAKIETVVNDDLPYNIEGYRFYVNTHTISAEPTYFLWRLNSTYKYSADLIIRWMFDGQLHQFTNSDSLRYCWISKKIYTYFLFNNENINTNTIHNFPLHYVATDVRDLSIRYSLMTTQYSISKDAYTFWSKVKEQNENLGDLYTRQPFQIRGNVFNIDNSDEPVLGYFTVAGISKKRIFVNKPDPPVKMRYDGCKLVEQDYMNFGLLFLTSPAEWPEFATFDQNGANAYPPQVCLDCREKGGTIEKPDFWTNQ